MLRQVCAEQQIATEPMPEGVRCRDSAAYRFYFTHGPEPVAHAGATLPAAGVHWVAR